MMSMIESDATSFAGKEVLLREVATEVVIDVKKEVGVGRNGLTGALFFFTTSKYHLASEELLTIITYTILFKHHTLIPVSDPIRKLLNLPNSLPLFLKPSKDVQLHLL